MISTEEKNRIKGALAGAFIGDALAVGCHWYYDLDQMRKECGEWVDDYIKAKKGHYHEHQKAGDSSQSGYILRLMLESLISSRGYNQKDFCKTLEAKLFPKIEGTAMGGIGGYTSQSIREVYHKRKQGLNWDEVATDVDNTEALERNIAIALAYAFDEEKLATHIYNNTKLTQKDEMLLAQTVAFGAVLSQLIQGEKLDENISSKLMALVKSKKLPFHTVTSDNLTAPKGEEKQRKNSINISSPDALLTPSYMAQAVNDNDILIEPAWKVSLVYGMPCAI
jgi:ADP-ribosylglycohydrolase